MDSIIDEWQSYNETMKALRFSTEVRCTKHNQAKEDLMENGYTEEEAVRIIQLVVNGKIRRLHFNY